jgi:hypothetical protein
MACFKWPLCICTIFFKIAFVKCLVLDGEISTEKQVWHWVNSTRCSPIHSIVSLERSLSDIGLLDETMDMLGYRATDSTDIHAFFTLQDWQFIARFCFRKSLAKMTFHFVYPDVSNFINNQMIYAISASVSSDLIRCFCTNFTTNLFTSQSC